MRTIFCIFLLLLTAPVIAQQIPPRLYINETRPAGQYVEIDYDINYGGFVELHLFNEDGDKVWIFGVVQDKVGSYTFRVPTKPLQSGDRYSYHFRYKGEEYHGSFYAP